jgi:gluconolactonase
MISNNKLFTSLSLTLTALLFACSSNPADKSAQTAKSSKLAADWSCPAQPGTAPSGDLVAERIPAANTTRTEPGLFEGAVWHGDSLYYSDFVFSQGNSSRIMRLDADGKVSVAIENSGSNGLALGPDGKLLAATHDKKALSLYDLETGEREIVINQFQNNPFNSPNDLTMSRSGVIYFTDPGYQRAAAPGGQPLTRVYQVKDKMVTVVDETITNPNGIGLSPDQKTLYVAGDGSLWTYPITAEGVGKGTILSPITQPDGLAVDCLGNIYATEHGEKRVRVVSPTGESLAVIRVDANVTNTAFGGKDRKTLFITGAGAVWKIDLDVAGMPY